MSHISNTLLCSTIKIKSISSLLTNMPKNTSAFLFCYYPNHRSKKSFLALCSLYRKTNQVLWQNSTISNTVKFDNHIMLRIMQNEANSVTDEGNVVPASTRRELVQNELSNRNSETRRIRFEVPRGKWNILSEVINCQLGRNPVLQRKFYGSLHGVQRLELKYNLIDNEMYEVRSLNFNRKGNLLVNISYNKIFIWNWTTGKRTLLSCTKDNRAEYLFQAKWFNMDSLVISNFRGELFLVHLKHNILEKFAKLSIRSKLTVVHDETPHVILSATRKANVFSIDMRQKEINRLFSVKEGALKVPLNSIDSNPFNSNEFCISGDSGFVMVFDRRNVLMPLRKFLPYHMEGYYDPCCALYNYNGTEILASYKNNVYLFDMLKSSNEETHKYKNHFNYVRVCRLIAEEGIKFFGPKSEYIISGSESGHIFIWDKITGALVNCIKSNVHLHIRVNCLEGHPHLPIFAIQRAHKRIGIWQPFCNYDYII